MSAQLALFSDNLLKPNGLNYVPDVITDSDEAALVEEISMLTLAPFQFGQFEGKRRVVWFGYSYDYQLHRLVESEPIPSWLHPLVTLVEKFGGPGTRIEQVLCTEYDAGVGIGWHRDKPHFDRIFGLSLGSACKFRFRRPAHSADVKAMTKGWERFTLDVAPLPGVEQRRHSITFRTLRPRKN